MTRDLWIPLTETATCPNCDYALRGLSVSLCPECGRDFTEWDLVQQRRRAAFRQQWLSRWWPFALAFGAAFVAPPPLLQPRWLVPVVTAAGCALLSFIAASSVLQRDRWRMFDIACRACLATQCAWVLLSVCQVAISVFTEDPTPPALFTCLLTPTLLFFSGGLAVVVWKTGDDLISDHRRASIIKLFPGIFIYLWSVLLTLQWFGRAT
ncbi:MAG: hypothetical protein ACR2GY_11660 [Phycisphaerales bacterium]